MGYKRAVTVDLLVESDEGATFKFRHEVGPVVTLDAAVNSAEEALKRCAKNLLDVITLIRPGCFDAAVLFYGSARIAANAPRRPINPTPHLPESEHLPRELRAVAGGKPLALQERLLLITSASFCKAIVQPTENHLIGDCTRICMSNPYCLCAIQESPSLLLKRSWVRQADDSEKTTPVRRTTKCRSPRAPVEARNRRFVASAPVAIVGQQSRMGWTDVRSCFKSGGKADVPRGRICAKALNRCRDSPLRRAAFLRAR